MIKKKINKYDNLQEATIQAMLGKLKKCCAINDERPTDSKIRNREKLQQAFIDLVQNNNNI